MGELKKHLEKYTTSDLYFLLEQLERERRDYLEKIKNIKIFIKIIEIEIEQRGDNDISALELYIKTGKQPDQSF